MTKRVPQDHPEKQCSALSDGIKDGPKPIVFITGNLNKLREVSAILNDNKEGVKIPIINQLIDLPELQGTPETISREKCLAMEVNGPVMVEDTCLCFNALGGLPGPYIKWFLDECGLDGLNKMLVGFDDKTGYALATFSFKAGPGQTVHTFVGKTEGTIVQARGKDGFGWDPIFEPTEGKGKTFAELSSDEKNAIYHRRRGLEKLQSFLLENKNLWQ